MLIYNCALDIFNIRTLDMFELDKVLDKEVNSREGNIVQNHQVFFSVRGSVLNGECVIAHGHGIIHVDRNVIGITISFECFGFEFVDPLLI